MKNQIEEMVKAIDECPYIAEPIGADKHEGSIRIAEYLVNQKGYRKQSENTVELPCKVGNMVYMPWEWDGVKSIAWLKVTAISNILGLGWSFGTDFDTDEEGYAEKYNYGRFKFDDVGKIVFLTHEEAEAVLAKMKGGAE